MNGKNTRHILIGVIAIFGMGIILGCSLSAPSIADNETLRQERDEAERQRDIARDLQARYLEQWTRCGHIVTDLRSQQEKLRQKAERNIHIEMSDNKVYCGSADCSGAVPLITIDGKEYK